MKEELSGSLSICAGMVSVIRIWASTTKTETNSVGSGYLHKKFPEWIDWVLKANNAHGFAVKSDKGACRSQIK